jgi:TolA-binding protein
MKSLEPDTPVAGMNARRLPTLREAMEQVTAKQDTLHETLLEVREQVLGVRLLVAELADALTLLQGEFTTPRGSVQQPPRRRSAQRRARSAGSAPHGGQEQSPASELPAEAGKNVQRAKPVGEPVSVVQQYVRALQAIARQQYGEALPLLNAVLAGAKDPTLLSNARYWRGEILFRQGDYAGAAAELQRVAQHPGAPKAAAALALLAECRLKQGDREHARQTLQQLLQQFPTSEFAPRARKLLQQL